MSLLSKLARAIGFVDQPAPVSSARHDHSPKPHDDRTGGVPNADAGPIASIAVGADGRYHAAGYSFTSERQALDFVRRRTSMSDMSDVIHSLQPARQLDERVGDGSKRPGTFDRMQGAEPRPGTPAITADAADAADGIITTADGRFRAGGYSFATEHQARDFLRRHLRPFSPSASDHRAALQPARRLEEQRPAYRERGTAPAPAKPVAAAKRTGVHWIVEPARETIAGITFDAHLVYVGGRDQQAYPRNQSAIDHALPVGTRDDPEGTALSWSPDYCFMTPETRRSYLVWLAAGRPGGAAIGYVKLYFAGLERRLLFDGLQRSVGNEKHLNGSELSEAKAEAPAILAELRRLIGLYGDHYDFGPAARKLADVATLMAGEEPPAPTPSLSMHNGYELPLGLRIQLGERVGAGQPLDADLALCWLLAMPNTWPRTPVKRCFDEFVALWRVRFAIAYPAGLKVRTPKARIAYRYQSSAGFHADVTLNAVPDLSGTTAPIVRLHELMTECSDRLAPYSRFLGSDEAARGTLAAAMLLPVELATGPFGQPLAVARSAITQLVRNEAPVAADAVLAAAGLPAATTPLNAAQQRQLAQRLDLLGIGFEPDRRYGAAGALRGDTPLALFDALGGGPVDASDPAYGTARLLLDVAILAAAADSHIVPAEIDAITAHVRNAPGLDDHARLRLMAALRVIPHDQPKLSAALKRLGTLPAAARREVAMAATAAVLADGQVLPAEVRFLEKLFDTLELARDELYGLLHRGGEADEPVSVMPARPEAGVALPREAAPGALVIDTGRLDRIRSETSDVSRLLASIFVEEAPAAATPKAPITSSRFAGLDAGHAALLDAIIAAPMPRGAFDNAARAARLMPNGAIETINEWGFDRFDEPVIEDGDAIAVPAHLLAQLQQTDHP